MAQWCADRLTALLTAVLTDELAARSGTELVKGCETDGHADLMSASGLGSLIQATVGSLGGVGRRWRNLAGLAA